MFVFSQGQVNICTQSTCLIYRYVEHSSITLFILNPSIQGESFIFSNKVQLIFLNARGSLCFDEFAFLNFSD